MQFKQVLVSKLSQSNLLKDELSIYNGELAIFEQCVPNDAKTPFIKYYTTAYSVPTIKQTVCLTVSFYKADMNTDDTKYIMFEIAEILDNKLFRAPNKDDLRIFIASNPVYVLGSLDERCNHASINFIIRGAINQWGVFGYGKTSNN